MQAVKTSYLRRAMNTLPFVNDIAWLRHLWLLTLVSSFLVPAFVTWPFGFRLTTLRVLIVGFVYLFVLAFLAQRSRIRVKNGVGRYVLFLALWLVWAFVSLWWAIPYSGWVLHIQALTVGILFAFFSVLLLNTETGLKSLSLLWVILAAVFVGMAVWESITGMYLNVSREAQAASVRETVPAAVFYNQNDFATFLCVSMPFAFVALGFARSAFLKILPVILLLASAYFIASLSSRANILAVLVGIFCAVILLKFKSRLRLISVALAIALLALILSYTLSWSATNGFFDWLGKIPQQLFSISTDDPSTVTRMNLVRDGWEFLKTSHFLGVGADSFETWVAGSSLYNTSGIVNAHNFWLEVLVDYGVPIFALFVTFYLGLLWNLLGIMRRSESPVLRAVSRATFVSLVMFSVACLSSSSLIAQLFPWLLFATALCIISCHRLAERRNRGTS